MKHGSTHAAEIKRLTTASFTLRKISRGQFVSPADALAADNTRLKSVKRTKRIKRNNRSKRGNR